MDKGLGLATRWSRKEIRQKKDEHLSSSFLVIIKHLHHQL